MSSTWYIEKIVLSNGTWLLGVPGDPNGTQQAPAGSIAQAIDGSGPWKNTTGAMIWTDISSGGETLAQTLALGNTTGGTRIIVSPGDVIELPDGTELHGVPSDPNGITTAPMGSLALAADGSGPWKNTTGAMIWVNVIGGGAGSLAATLAVGNTTGGTNVIVSDGDVIQGEAAAPASGLAGKALVVEGGAGDGIGRRGPIILRVGADGAAQVDAGGNARGIGAIDFQSVRTLATQVASGKNSFIGAGIRNTASGNSSTAEGGDSVAFGDYSHAEGAQCKAGPYAHAEGFATYAPYSAHSEGNTTIASGYYSHAEGITTTASGKGAHAEGISTLASGKYSHAEGKLTTAGDYGHAEGFNSTAGYVAHAEGYSQATGDYSHSEGNTTLASGKHSHAEGSGTTASGFYSHSEGKNTLASGFGAHAEGAETIANNVYGHAEGHRTTASAYFSHAQGHQALADRMGQLAVASGRTENPVGGRGAAQFSLFCAQIRTPNAAAAELFLGETLGAFPADRMVLRENTTWGFTGIVTARRTIGISVGDSSSWKIEGVIKRTAGVTVMVAAAAITLISQDVGAAAWVTTVTADAGNNSLKITGAGDAAETVQWEAVVMVAETGAGA